MKMRQENGFSCLVFLVFFWSKRLFLVFYFPVNQERKCGPQGNDGAKDPKLCPFPDDHGTENLAAKLEFKSKRYALARLRRMCLAAALGLEKDSARGLPPYARVLAFNQRGQTLLRELDGAEKSAGGGEER